MKTMESNQNTTNPQPAPPALKRTFVVGDEWLYYKFYCGPKTADVLLTEMVKPLTEELLEKKVIDRWFFIRYGDPKLHARVRFHVSNPQYLGPVILSIRNHAVRYIEQNLVWKVQLDTYDREVERYGTRTMEMGERIFFHDSKMIVDMLAMIEGDEGERVRWLFGLRAVDSLLNDFHFPMEEKFTLVTTLRENFGREHNMNKNLKSQMEKKFRASRGEINELLNRENDKVSELLPLFQMIDQKSAAVRPIADQILAMKDREELEMPFYDLMSSYSHMLINRLFKSKQRTHELVLYDFLHRYYKSEIARQKYSKQNAQKAKAGKKSKSKTKSKSKN
ncbi:MAG: hypothetical protein GY940_15170 [bacterium]|nr:hypothetical protein [bacterium]